MSDHLPDARCVCRVSTALGMAEAIRSGMGIGHLACLAGDSEEQLGRLSDPHTELNLQLWILMHQDLKRSTRIRVFCDFLAGELRSRRNLIEGRTGSSLFREWGQTPASG